MSNKVGIYSMIYLSYSYTSKIRERNKMLKINFSALNSTGFLSAYDNEVAIHDLAPLASL